VHGNGFSGEGGRGGRCAESCGRSLIELQASRTSGIAAVGRPSTARKTKRRRGQAPDSLVRAAQKGMERAGAARPERQLQASVLLGRGDL